MGVIGGDGAGWLLGWFALVSVLSVFSVVSLNHQKSTTENTEHTETQPQQGSRRRRKLVADLHEVQCDALASDVWVYRL